MLKPKVAEEEEVKEEIPAIISPVEAASPVDMDAKFKYLLRDLESTKAKDPSIKSLIFTQFTSSMVILETLLKQNGHDCVALNGGMTITQRARALQRFKEDDNVNVFLLSVRSAASGLTLTSASRVYMLEPCLNPMLAAQAVNRVHRIGQTREVVVKHLVANNTVERRIVEMNKDKYDNERIDITQLDPRKSVSSIREANLRLLFQAYGEEPNNPATTPTPAPKS
jgi:SNF2 family DNA or RNA helicase